jgi:hypothetical protein
MPFVGLENYKFSIDLKLFITDYGNCKLMNAVLYAVMTDIALAWSFWFEFYSYGKINVSKI